MNDLLLEYLLKDIKIDTDKEKKIKIDFLDKYGEGLSEEDELIKKLICQDEEGKNYF